MSRAGLGKSGQRGEPAGRRGRGALVRTRSRAGLGKNREYAESRPVGAGEALSCLGSQAR